MGLHQEAGLLAGLITDLNRALGTGVLSKLALIDTLSP